MSREQGGELSTSNLEKCSLLIFAARLFFRTATFESATFQITVYSFSRRDFFSQRHFRKRNVPNYSLFTPFRGATFFFAALPSKAQRSKLQFTFFRGASFEIAVYSFSWRYFRSCSLLVFAVRLVILQFILFRSANFESALYSCLLPKPSPITRNHPNMLPHPSKTVPTCPPNGPKMPPKTSGNQEQIKSRRENDKSVKKRGPTQ